MIERRIDLESADVSILSFEALDSLLSSESISVESEDALLQFILKLGLDYRDLLSHIQIEFLSEDGLSLLDEHFGIPPESVWQCAVELVIPPPPLDSRIISDFPKIFAEFRRKRFSLLWRGSRDGFKLTEFHRRCDGHANTLTVILDTKGNIFGGFTPVKWESPTTWKAMADDRLTSFIFTLKNPHNLRARKFGLNAAEKHHAIGCGSPYGPWFDCAIAVLEKCNSRTDNVGYIGRVYINDTELDGKTILTGSTRFQVQEIEIFEIKD
jgi:hypothetical protein